eukprot:CAMPEP_0180398710 /NCGR_PEP_ID=MMETSP0989-20121125/36766_1 /TAXON_ID=697907 /ORGANISM="non described non described, Strain CCMP2293" /LENGTH=293 /DNA_ID=CAMNT_0022401355 /DNA_START=102 /DNA_END=979 /DNA_ORIENTATION=+
MSSMWGTGRHTETTKPVSAAGLASPGGAARSLPPRDSRAGGSTTKAKRVSVLEELEKTLDQGRPWKLPGASAGGNDGDARSRGVGGVRSESPSVRSESPSVRMGSRDGPGDRGSLASSLARVGMGDATPRAGRPTTPSYGAAGGAGWSGSGDATPRGGSAQDLPSTLSGSHEVIRRLRETLEATEARMGAESRQKDETLEGLSDMFALQALLPDQTRLFKEHNEARAKYQALVAELAASRAEVAALKEDQTGGLQRAREALADALQSVSAKDRLLEAERTRSEKATRRAEEDA